MEASKEFQRMIDDLLKMISETGNFMRPNQYRVEIDLPEALRGKYADYIETIGLMCTSTSIPGFSIDEKESDKSNNIFTPHSHNYTTEDYKFLVGRDMKVRQLFLDWRALIVDHDTKLLGYTDDYAGQFRLYPMKRGKGSKEENTTAEIILDTAYPVTLGAISMSYEENNTIAYQNVTIRFFSKKENFENIGDVNV